MEQYIDKENELSKLANQWKKDRKWENISIEELPDKEYVVSLKIDGELTAFEYKNGDITYSSRHGKIRKNLPFDKELIESFRKYKKVIGFGELYAVDKNGSILPYTQSMSILRKPNEENINQIRFKIFDIYQINDKKIEMPYLKRVSLIKKILNKKFAINAIKSSKNKISEIFDKYVKSGKYEGLVIWDDQKTYKIKEFINLDAVVIFVEKSDKHPDRMGALGLALLDNNKFYYIGNVGTGFTEDQRIKWLRYALKNKIKEDNGKIFISPKIIVEVNAKTLNFGTNIIYNKKYDVIGHSQFGSLREPKFIRIRKDKTISDDNIGLSQIKNFVKRSLFDYKKISNINNNWFMCNTFKKIAISLNQIDIEIPQDLSQGHKIEKIFNIVYMDPTSKLDNQKLEFKNLEEFINKFLMEYKGNKYLNIKKMKMITGDYLGVINKFYENLIEYGAINIRNSIINLTRKTENKPKLINVKSFDELKQLLGLQQNKDIKIEKHYEKIAAKQIGNISYVLYKALSPFGIKNLANKGVSTWCVNSIEYAKSYWDANETKQNGFWYIFRNGKPFFSIGGNDGISSIFNVSLSLYSIHIYEPDYLILKEWQNIYNYPLKEQKVLNDLEFNEKIKKIIENINLKEFIPDSDYEFIFNYSEYFKDKIDINKFLEYILDIKKKIFLQNSIILEKSDLLLNTAKFIVRSPFEKNPQINKDLLERIEEILSSDYENSVDYLRTIVKGYSENYKSYMLKLLKNIYESISSKDANSVDIEEGKLSNIIDLFYDSKHEITNDERKYFDLLIEKVPYVFLLAYDKLKDIGINYEKDKLFSAVVNNPIYSFKYAKGLGFTDVSFKILESISKNDILSYRYALHLKGKKVPVIIENGIAKSPRLSFLYAYRVLNFQNVPPIIIDSIAKDYNVSILYAIINKDNIPGQIKRKIMLESGIDIEKNKNNFENFVFSCALGSSERAFEFAKSHKFKDIPLEIIKKISESPYYSWGYARAIGYQGVPKEIIEGISKDNHFSFLYTTEVDPQNVPEVIFLSALKDSKDNSMDFKIKNALRFINENRLDLLKEVNIKKSDIEPYLGSNPNKENILKHLESSSECFIAKEGLRYNWGYDIDEKVYGDNREAHDKNSFLFKKAAFETNSLQLRIEGQLKDDIISFAKRNFLQKYLYYNTNLYILGRVYNPHIILMYFKKDIFKEIVRHLKEKGVEYIEFTLGNIKKFSSDKDVFYIEVRSEQLDNLVNELAERFDEQQPFKFLAHITLAYVKNGTHDFLLNNAHFQGIKYKTSIIEVSYYDNNKGGEYYNLKNNDTGKVVDFLYKHNIDVSKIKPGNVGFDFDYTLTMNPNQFKKIIDHIHSNGHKVFIITGRGPSLTSYINEFLNKNNINVDGVYNFEKELTDEDFVNPETKKQIAKFKKDKIKELEISTFFDDDFFIISNLPNNIDKYFVPAGVQKVNNGKFIYPEKSHNKFEQIINKLLYVANKYGYKIYAAGGYVRDLIMDRDSKDLDIIVVKDSEGVNAPIEFAKKVKEEFGGNIYE